MCAVLLSALHIL